MSKQPEELERVCGCSFKDVVSSLGSMWNDYYGSLCCVYVSVLMCVGAVMCVVTTAAVGYKWKTFPREKGSTLLLDKRH